MRQYSYTVNDGEVVEDVLNLTHPPVGINVLDASDKCIVSAVPPCEDSEFFYIEEIDQKIRGKNVSDKLLRELLEDGHIEKKDNIE